MTKFLKENLRFLILGSAITVGLIIWAYCFSEMLKLEYPYKGGVWQLTHVVKVTKYKEEIIPVTIPEGYTDVEYAITVINSLPVCALNWNKNPITGEPFNDKYCTNVDPSSAAPAVCRIFHDQVIGYCN